MFKIAYLNKPFYRLCNVMSIACSKLTAQVRYFVLLLEYFPKYVRSVKYDCFLQFHDVVLSRYVGSMRGEAERYTPGGRGFDS